MHVYIYTYNMHSKQFNTYTYAHMYSTIQHIEITWNYNTENVDNNAQPKWDG